MSAGTARGGRAIRALAVVAAVVTLGLTAGCSSGGASGDPADYTAVIDVRTPAEYAEGHVTGAENIDVEAADFAARVAELPDEGTYLVYCRSGNRAGQAKAIMEEAGLDVVNGGGLTDMGAAGFTME